MQRYLKRKCEGVESSCYSRSQNKKKNFPYFILLSLYFHQIMSRTFGVFDSFCQRDVFMDRYFGDLGRIHSLSLHQGLRLLQLVFLGNSLWILPSFYRHSAFVYKIHRLVRRLPVIQRTQDSNLSFNNLDCFVFVHLAFVHNYRDSSLDKMKMLKE